MVRELGAEEDIWAYEGRGDRGVGKTTNQELNDLYSSPNIVRVNKSRRMRWVGHVACMGERRGHTEIWDGDLREGHHLGYPGVDGRIIPKWIFKKWDGGMDWIELAQDRDRWRALVNAVMNLRVRQNSGIS
jgi:hypothetical protein